MKALIASTLLFLAAMPTYAVTVEAGVGTTRYTLQPDGTWYQRGMPYKIQSSGMGYLVGLRGSAIRRDTFGIDWHADYVNLGAITSFCRCTTVDADYDMKAHRLMKANTPIADYSGHGSAHGFKLSLAPYVRVAGWDVGVEAGVFIHRPNWNEKVYSWTDGHGSSPVDGRHDTPQHWTASKMIGVFIRQDRLTVSYSYYRLPTRYRPTIDNPALWTGAYILMFSYSFGGPK